MCEGAEIGGGAVRNNGRDGEVSVHVTGAH